MIRGGATLSPGERRLSSGERRELLYMRTAPQTTFGKGRVAIQNRLIAKGLAVLVDDGTLCILTSPGKEIADVLFREKR